MALVLVVEFVDRTTTVYPSWDDLIKDLKRSRPKIRFGTLNIAMPEWTAQALLRRKGGSVGLVEGGEIVGKISVKEL